MKSREYQPARRAYRKKWKRENYVHILISNAARRARSKGMDFDLSADDIAIPKLCLVLGMPLKIHVGEGKARPDSPSLDRIDSSRGYTRDNVRIVSFRANVLKLDATDEELAQLGRDAQARLNQAAGPEPQTEPETDPTWRPVAGDGGAK